MRRLATERRLEIRDPVHGRIDLTPYQAVLDSPPVQRMRHIKQLGGIYYGWPGAVHSRHNHLQGTAYIAQERGWWLVREQRFSGDDVRLVVVGALCHDVGHWSFSHLMEPCFGNHDERGQEIILGELAPYIAECGVDPREVAELCNRQHPLSDILFPNPIGADKLDYLVRDAYFALGDRRCFDDLYTYQISWERRDGLFVLPDGLDKLCEAIEFSWHMFTGLYEHPNSRVIQRPIQELVRQMVEVNPIVKERLFNAGEDAVMGAIGYWCEQPENQDHECVERYRRIEGRNHPQKALIFSAHPNVVAVNPHSGLVKLECDERLVTASESWPVPKIAEIEGQIAALLGVSPPSVTLAIAPPSRRWKVPEVKVMDNGSVHLIGDIQPGLHEAAKEKARVVHNIVVAVDEDRRVEVASDAGLQAAIQSILTEA